MHQSFLFYCKSIFEKIVHNFTSTLQSLKQFDEHHSAWLVFCTVQKGNLAVRSYHDKLTCYTEDFRAIYPCGYFVVPPLYTIHRKKSFSIFPSPAGMSLIKLSLGDNNDVIYKLFPPRESLVSDIPAGDGSIQKFFFLTGHFSPDWSTLASQEGSRARLTCLLLSVSGPYTWTTRKDF